MIREVHRGIVLDNSAKADPEKRGGIRVELVSVTGGGEYPVTAYPAFPYAGSDRGFFFPPPIGTLVEVEIPSGEGVIDNSDFCYYRGALYSVDHDIPDEFKDNYPFRMGIKSAKGHILMFDDKTGQELLQLMFKGKYGITADKNGLYLGGGSGTQNFVLGQILKTVLATFMSAFETHVHAPPIGGPPANAAAVATIRTGQVESEAILSSYIFGDKDKPT